MSYTSLGTALYTLLNDASFKTSAGIAAVYNYGKRDITTYPILTIVASGHKNDFLTTVANKRTYVYTVRALVRAPNDSDSEVLIRSITDAVINRIEANYSLSGACEWMTPTSASLSWSTDDQPVRYADITVEINVRYTRP